MQQGMVIQGFFPHGLIVPGVSLQRHTAAPEWVRQSVMKGAGRAQTVTQPALRAPSNDTATPLPPGQMHFGMTGGQPLPANVRQGMESIFAANFSDVRVHVGPAARAIGATAFTQGSHVHFAPGGYDTGSSQGLRLLGHELAHVVQQRAGRVRNPFGHGLVVVQNAALEAEAERMGSRVATAYASLQAKMIQLAARTRARTLEELQVSADLNERLVIDWDERSLRTPAERKGVARYGIGDSTGWGVGAYAVYEGVSTTNGTQRFSAGERAKVDALGNTYGCQQCGTKAHGNANGHWTPDHQPPLSVWKERNPGKPYKGALYPHCRKCSGAQGGALGSMCFLTTACVQFRGLADDCEELTVLRSFRDDYLLTDRDGGSSLVEEYYRIAPAIVQTIQRRDDAAGIYEHVHGVVRRCVDAIGGRRPEVALTLYRQMVLDLAALP